MANVRRTFVDPERNGGARCVAHPPQKGAFTIPDYMTDIGLTYLTYPIVTIGFGYLLVAKGVSRA